MPVAAVLLTKKISHLQVERMHHRPRGPSSGQCSVSCQKTSNMVDPLARYGRDARRRCSSINFSPVAEHLHLKFRVAITVAHFSQQGSQQSKHSSLSGSSQHTFPACTSSSGYDVHVEEACEVVLSTSGQEVKSDGLYTQTTGLQNDDLRILLELNSSEFALNKKHLSKLQ